MLNSKLIFFLALLLSIATLSGCVEDKNKLDLPSDVYNFNDPSVLILNDALQEISGIYFYAKDTSVFAIADEEDYLFKIHLNNNVTQKWKFGKYNDYEDLYLLENTFYILESSGSIHTLNFSQNGDTIYEGKNDLSHHEGLEFESLYYDDQLKLLVMICKDCDNDKNGFSTAWAFDPNSKVYERDIFKIDVKSIAKRTGKKKIKFKPSAAAINPETGDIWILSAVNQLIAVTDREGNFKDAYTLDPRIFTQPEGIAFTPWGDLIISDEAGDKYGKGNLLIFKKKK